MDPRTREERLAEFRRLFDADMLEEAEAVLATIPPITLEELHVLLARPNWKTRNSHRGSLKLSNVPTSAVAAGRWPERQDEVGCLLGASRCLTNS